MNIPTRVRMVLIVSSSLFLFILYNLFCLEIVKNCDILVYRPGGEDIYIHTLSPASLVSIHIVVDEGAYVNSQKGHRH